MSLCVCEREREGFISYRLLLLSMGDGEGPHDRKFQEIVEQEIPDWLVKIVLLREVGHTIKSGGMIGFSTPDTILVL